MSVHTTFKNITQSYIQQHAIFMKENNKQVRKMERLEKRIEVIRAEYNSLWSTYPDWINNLLIPVIRLIESQIPGWKADTERLTPFGLGNRVTVFFIRADILEGADDCAPQNSVYLEFMPGNPVHGELQYIIKTLPVVSDPVPEDCRMEIFATINNIVDVTNYLQILIRASNEARDSNNQ